MRKHIILLVHILLIINVLFANPAMAEDIDEGNVNIAGDVEDRIKPQKGKVLEVLSDEVQNLHSQETDPNSGIKIRRQIVEVEITTGTHSGKRLETENYIDAYNMVVEKGNEVLLYINEDTDGELTGVYIMEIVRHKYLMYVVCIFILLLLFIGGVKGLKTIITLVFTGIAVMKILLPLMLKGHDPVWLSVTVCTLIVIFTLIIVSGANKKTFSAIIGTTGGVLIAGLIAWVMGVFARLTGLGSEEAQMLLYIPQGIQFDFKGLLFAGIIIGAMGAVMDVSMSISSSMNEVLLANPRISNRELMKAGMSLGKDIMGTMANTLILAYVGSSLHLLLLFMAYEVPIMEVINRDLIASEIVRAMAGSIGLIVAIPLTALSVIALQGSRH